MRIYVENGATRPFNAVMETPRGPNTVAVRNIGQLEFPMAAQIEAVSAAGPLGDMERIDHGPMTIQGGALRTYPFDPNVDSVQILLKTDGRPLNSRIELLQGPNNNKQVIELYTEDGLDRPFYAIIETPGSGNVVRIVNTATVEFPLTCSVGAYRHSEKDSFDEMQPVISGYGAENRYGGQVIELYTEDGLDRPFYAIIETPGSGNVVRIVNTATVEFPLTCSVGAYRLSEKDSFDEMQPVISGYGAENRYGGPDYGRGR
eukprot:CAMPEP_0194194818 /NCGR_PEP_ID=MMETSP0154-20130528/75775_1 /TAXON_ID=1049557 /ORGANISM="Thalassiothrix antarctica, Strain L6-D1" /LENGTH=259 /DNA_ID=CAMNT_0038919281 /DNA_START=1 /DNA_END=780 /DNA_ORIENTATION=+